jgi:hypothetical protein
MAVEPGPGGSPDFYLGDSEGVPAHWGGTPRRAFVLGHPTLATGSQAFLVRLDPPLPAVKGGQFEEAIVMPRYAGRALDQLGDESIIVNILRPTGDVDIRKARFQDGDLVVEFWADAAASIDALPKPIDEHAYWARTLARITRFIEQHGHADVPTGYEDEEGRLDVIVGNIRWHHAGKGGVSPGPFPGIDYAPELDRLPGWTW